MPRPILVLQITALIAAGPAVAFDSPSDLDASGYRAGVELFHDGKYRDAAASFERAISLAPQADADSDYMPYLYLAASHFQLGNACTARLAFSQAQTVGEAEKSDYGQTLIEHYERYMASPASAADGLEPVDYARDRVLQRCRLSEDVASNPYPWYFHYLLGLEYDAAGDVEEALNAFLLGANLLQVPERRKRVYGMHFVDYLPYFQIARAHARLGEWTRARDALNLSRALGEFSPGDPDFERFTALDSQVAAKLGGPSL